MQPSTPAPVVDVVPLIENQKVGRFWFLLFAVSWAVTFLDGFDLQIISFAGRYIIEDFGLTNTQLGTLGSLGTFGTLLGGFAMGYLGDRFGRKPAIIVSTVGFGAFMLLFAAAQDYTQLAILRLVTGIFLGGALPLTWALVTEFAPLRLRSTAVIVTMIGYSLGSAAGGPVSNALIPRFGWEAVFIAGGVASLLAVIPVLIWMPESVKYLAQRDIKQDRIAGILRRVVPDQQFPAGTRFEVGGLTDRSPFRPSMLFRGGRLALITPLVWITYLSSSVLIFYMAFWGPILNERMGFSVSAAATLAMWGAIAGAVGQLVIGRFIDHRGAGTIALMPLLSIPSLLLLGLVDLGTVGYVVMILFAGLVITGGHGGVISITSIFYRPAIRANGAGWATSVAKVGAMVGPWLAGFIMDAGGTAQSTFFVFAIFPVVMVILLVILGRIQRTLPPDQDGSLTAAPTPAATASSD